MRKQNWAEWLTKLADEAEAVVQNVGRRVLVLLITVALLTQATLCAFQIVKPVAVQTVATYRFIYDNTTEIIGSVLTVLIFVLVAKLYRFED